MGLYDTPTVSLQRSKTLLPYGTTYWAQLTTCNAWQWDLVAVSSLQLVLSGQMTSNIPFQPLHGLDGWLERPNPISWLVMSNSSTYMIKSWLYSSNCSYGKQTPNSYLKVVAKGLHQEKQLMKIISTSLFIHMKFIHKLRDGFYLHGVNENYFYQFIYTHKSYKQDVA